MTTVTPGSTLPAVSFTTPEIEAVDCAKLLRGTKTANSATTSATLPYQAGRNILFLPQASGRMPSTRRCRLASAVARLSAEAYALARVTVKHEFGMDRRPTRQFWPF